MTPSDSNGTPPDPKQRPIVLTPITGPSMPDMDALRSESLRRHEEELARAERLVAQARAGTGPSPAEHRENARPEPGAGEYLVDFDWRGETASYVEQNRRVTLSCAYWGGPKGSVSHMYGVWEHAHDRREPLTAAERKTVLARVIDRAAQFHGITLAISGE